MLLIDAYFQTCTPKLVGGPVAETTYSEWLKLHWTGGALCEDDFHEFWNLYYLGRP